MSPWWNFCPKREPPSKRTWEAQRQLGRHRRFLRRHASHRVIDRCIPAQENPHEAKPLEAEAPLSPAPLLRLGGMTALPLPSTISRRAGHLRLRPPGPRHRPGPSWWPLPFTTFPRGSPSQSPFTSHWLPAEAFVWSFLSGLAEPAGALLGWLLLAPVMSPTLFGLLYAGVAGIMVFISLDELLPPPGPMGSTTWPFTASSAVWP